MRYIIIGAGAVGGAIGGRLHAAGHDVVLVARGAHAAAVREEGLRLRTPDESLTLRGIPVAEGPEAVQLRRDDVLLLAVKTQDSVAALDAWAGRPVARGGTAGEVLPVFCAQNGVANEELALRRFRQVYGMCVWLPAQYLEPGVITAGGSPLTGMLITGGYPGGSDTTARRVAADLEKSQFLAPVTREVMRWKYAKLLTNLVNALEALCGPVRGEPLAGVGARAREEGVAALAAAGIPHATPEEEAELRGDRVRLLPVAGVERGGGSSWQSLRRGAGSIEADYLNGEIVLLGRRHGVPTPVNELLQRHANDFAHRGRPPGSLPVAELLGALNP
ncbi:2-dehydropantoate 2-reductase N-terminal domain-containing protein [Streptomyces sp. DSM 44917]|uniref:2-dehydropantoate 2-reductase N-terminal domain-containing protein n=1 Tax=Streptomyces boetiae TaxID=3075541 RepID=A0ABU2L6E2_9ACTN|nr:2-dehydropantoate 2-reductase N-terminal domain-containing protein [Streptomyces sp. DSM 44917]MDT0307135.1 2-dehydropantoate 2-reductase N-terminal domain-containing protein [Streptomyces sp. DSM 44917]